MGAGLRLEELARSMEPGAQVSRRLRLEELARSVEPGAQVSGRRALAGGAGSEHGARSAG